MIKTQFRMVWLLLFALLMAGCSSLKESTTNVEWQAHQQKLAAITDYRASGKLGYISPQERQSLNFTWRRSPQRSELRLSTFLGQTVLNMTITPSGAHVETYDDQKLDADNAEQLIYRLTGLVMPVAPLSSWLLGAPNQADNYQLNQTHTLSWLEKDLNGQRWHLDYLRYQDHPFNGLATPLPSKLKLTQNNITINLVISKWTFN
ncbi:lipoprotein insertase outer membrane protein LolB [Vibrio olivae]|uniref:Outer-membrane lipoprotein LolB n=1 Tax=Vibrio olivae TaxID=1243002 RepID=A0ABV5HL69_9VIBR